MLHKLAPIATFAATNRAAPSVTPNTVGSTVTTGGTANVATAWVELFSAATISADVHLLSLSVLDTLASTVDTAATIDIAIGAIGSEVPIITGIPVGWRVNGTTFPAWEIILPILIKAGNRISFRARAVQINKVINVAASVKGYDIRPARCFGGIDVIGVNTSTQKGTSITPGTAAMSSWASIGSALARDYDGVMPIIQGLPSATTMSTNAYFIEIGVGSKKLLGLDEWRFHTHSSEYTMGPEPAEFHYCQLKAGQQLQMRGSAPASPQTLDAVILAGWIS